MCCVYDFGGIILESPTRKHTLCATKTIKYSVLIYMLLQKSLKCGKFGKKLMRTGQSLLSEVIIQVFMYGYVLWRRCC